MVHGSGQFHTLSVLVDSSADSSSWTQGWPDSGLHFSPIDQPLLVRWIIISCTASLAPATSLQLRCPYDYAIDLLPGTTTPRGRFYSLSAPEREAMEKYVAGFMCPSSSPGGACFFLLTKKDGTLHPCIVFRGLNDKTIKNRYPLPIIFFAFELLKGACIHTKFDLCRAYHLVCI